MTVKWTKGALSNLALIAAHIERDNPLRARSFVQEIRAKTKALEHFPSVGHAGRVSGTRELVVHKNYIIAYRVRAEHVEIIRVQHVAKMWPERF